jgi:hypothetical protein
VKTASPEMFLLAPKDFPSYVFPPLSPLVCAIDVVTSPPYLDSESCTLIGHWSCPWPVLRCSSGCVCLDSGQETALCCNPAGLAEAIGFGEECLEHIGCISQSETWISLQMPSKCGLKNGGQCEKRGWLRVEGEVYQKDNPEAQQLARGT